VKEAHSHLLSALAAELSRADPGEGPLRLLDVGCGYGDLIAGLLEGLPKLGFAAERIELYGYEVVDQRARIPGYFEQLLESLGERFADVDWEKRLRLGGSEDPWPYPEGFFHAAFSNQVLEHVEELELFFGELSRVVRQGGVAVHYFPSKEIVVEPHSGVPLAHRFRGDSLGRWLRLCSRIGLGKYRRYRSGRGASLEEFGEEFRVYLSRFVFFRPGGSILRAARDSGCEAGFKYGRQLVGRAMKADWEPKAYVWEPCFAARSALAPFSSVTLVQQF